MNDPASRPRRFREVGQPRGRAQFAGVLLHGRGRAPEEKIDLAARLAHLEAIRWIVPAAETGSWYPNRFSDPLSANEPDLSYAVAECHEAMLEASEAGRLGPERLAVIGFSQGACIATEYVLRHPGKCGTTIVFTGGVMGLPAEIAMKTAPNLLAGLEVFLTGSDVDEWIPEEATRETARVLSESGANVTLRVYQGRPHIVSQEEMAEGTKFLEAHLLKQNL